MKNSPGFGSVTAVDGNLTAIIISGNSSEMLKMTSTQTLPISTGPDTAKSSTLVLASTKTCGSIEQNDTTESTEVSKLNVSLECAEGDAEGVDVSHTSVNRVQKIGQFLKIAPTNQADSRRLPLVKLVKSPNGDRNETEEQGPSLPGNVTVTEIPPLVTQSSKEKTGEVQASKSPDMPVLSSVSSSSDSEMPVLSPINDCSVSVVKEEESPKEEVPSIVLKRTARKTFPQPGVYAHQDPLREINSVKSESASVTNNSSSSSVVSKEDEVPVSDEPTMCPSPDADLLVIDGIEFRSFGTESELEDFCAKSTSRTLNVQKFIFNPDQHQSDGEECDEEDCDDEDDFDDLEEWGSRGYNSEGESSDDQGPPSFGGKRIIPTKTTDITKIKGWKNKFFSNYSGSRATADNMSSVKRENVSVDAGQSKEPNLGVQNSEDSGATRSVFVSDALDEFLKAKAPLKTANLVTTAAMQSMAILKTQEEKAAGKTANYPTVGANFQELMKPTIVTHERALKATLALLPFLVLSNKQKGEISFVETSPTVTQSTTITGAPMSSTTAITTGTVKPSFSLPQIEPPYIYYPPKYEPSAEPPKRNESCFVSAESALKAVEALVQHQVQAKVPSKVPQKAAEPKAQEQRFSPVPTEETPKPVAEVPSTPNVSSSCTQEFCQLGCVCDSLKTRKRSRKHCGRPQCMFSCRCDGFPPLPSSTRGKLLNSSVVDYEEDPPTKRRRQIRLPARLKDSAYVWTAGRELIECEIEVDDDKRDRKRPTMLRGIPGRVPMRGRPRLPYSPLISAGNNPSLGSPKNTSYRGRPPKNNSFVLLPNKSMTSEPIAATALADGRRSRSVEGRKREAATAELAMKIILVDREVNRTKAAFLCTKAGNVCAEFTVDSCSDCVLEWEIGTPPPQSSSTSTATSTTASSPKNVFVPLSASLQNNRVRTTIAGSTPASTAASRRQRPLTVQQQLSQHRLMKAAQMVASAGARASGKDGKYLFVTGSGELLPCVVVPVETQPGMKRSLPPLPPLAPVKKQMIVNSSKKPMATAAPKRAPSDLLSAALNDAVQRAKILQAARRNQMAAAASGNPTTTSNVTATAPTVTATASGSQFATSSLNGRESESDSSSTGEDSDWGEVDDLQQANKTTANDGTCSAIDDASMQTANGIKSCLERIRRQELAKYFLRLYNLLKPFVADKIWEDHKYPSKILVLTAATKSIHFLQDREKKCISEKKNLIAKRMRLFNSYTALLRGLEGSQQRAAVKILIRRLQECCRDRKKSQVSSETRPVNNSSVLQSTSQQRVPSDSSTSDDSTVSNSPELLQRLVATNNLEVIPIAPKEAEPEGQPIPLPSPTKAPDEDVSMATVTPVTPIVDPVIPQKCQPQVADSVNQKNGEQVQLDGTDCPNWPKIVAFMSISQAEFLSKENEVTPVKTST